MEIEIQLTNGPIGEKISPLLTPGSNGAWLEFRGVVRDSENGATISALDYEGYPEMAKRELHRLLADISQKHPCLAATVIHRLGTIPVGETAIYVGVAGKHRGEALALLAEFMDRLKQDVPIWKRRAIVAAASDPGGSGGVPTASAQRPPPSSAISLDEAVSKIESRCPPVSGIRVRLEESFGRVLREKVLAAEDFPACDRSTRDGFAILQNDPAEWFQVVDTIQAADWKPRQLQSGEAVRVATGAALPGDNLRVVMREYVERQGDRIHVLPHDRATNIRRRGEEVKAGEPLLPAGVRLDAGKMALLAAAGGAHPLVGPCLRVMHFTTGDELVPPDQTPKPGQIRDSNSLLIRGLLQPFGCKLAQAHLPEDFERAKARIKNHHSLIENADVVLFSGGASVGETDFTRPLLEWLGFEIVFAQINLRPGRPLIFGVRGKQIAFGLPGNPLAHFVGFHLFVATALAKLSGAEPAKWLRGRLAEPVCDASCPRETLWPARWDGAGLHPLAWASSGDLTCLAAANALVRVPAHQGSMDAGTEVDYLRA